jgi:hypothetical protein
MDSAVHVYGAALKTKKFLQYVQQIYNEFLLHG